MVKQMRRTLILSMLMLITCLGMLLGTTYAWFTDSASSGSNVIQAGNLDIDVEYTLDGDNWKKLDGAKDLFQKGSWEPGHTEVVALKIINNGTLALKYKALLNVYEEVIGKTKDGSDIKLSDLLIVSTLMPLADQGEDAVVKTAFNDANSVSYDKMAQFNLSEVLSKDIQLLPGTYNYLIIKVEMPDGYGEVINHNGKDVPKIEFGINVVATQYTYEEDSFGNQYDINAYYKTLIKVNESFYFAIEDSYVENDTFYSDNTASIDTLIDGNETTVTMDVTSTDAIKWIEGIFPSCGNVFASANGSLITVKDLTIEGKMMPVMAGYSEPNGTPFNTTLNNVTIVNTEIVSGLDGISPALFSSGNTTLNNCEINGTTSNSGDEAFDVAILDGKLNVYDSNIGSIHMTNDMSILEIKGGEVDYIRCDGDEEMWVYIKLGSVVNKIDAFGKNTHIIIETGATVGDINTSPDNADNVIVEDGADANVKVHVTTIDEIRKAIENGVKVFINNDIILEKATETLLYANQGKPIYVNGNGQTFVCNGNATGNVVGESMDYGYLGFIPYYGEDATIIDVRVTGTGFVEVGHYGTSEKGNYTINKLVVENIVGTLIIPKNGVMVVGAFTHYGYAVLTDCIMTGTTTQKEGKPYDAVLVNKSKTTIIGGKYGSILVDNNASVIIDGGAEIDIIDDNAIKPNSSSMGNLTIKKDVKIGTINLNDFSAKYLAYKAFKIEAGAQVGAIVYNGQTYTVEEWLVAYPSTLYTE